MAYRTTIEPFRSKTVEPIRRTTREERERALRSAHHNLFLLPARAAERILFGTMVKPGDVVQNNTHVDTTRANVEQRGGTAVDLPIAEGPKPDSDHPFKANMEVAKLDRVLADNPARVPLAIADRRRCADIVKCV